jgi:hypothetical protein
MARNESNTLGSRCYKAYADLCYTVSTLLPVFYVFLVEIAPLCTEYSTSAQNANPGSCELLIH